MDERGVAELLAGLRTLGAEATGVEVKRAGEALPRSCRETLSAFSNTPGGGVLLLGVSEGAGYAVDGLDDPARTQQDLVAMCSDDIDPPLRPAVSLVRVEGGRVLVAEVPELPKSQKPAYVKSLGMNRGSFLRVGESDRRLTSEEVAQLVADRGQPQFDREPVPGATPDDLDGPAVARYAERLRTTNPRVFADASDEEVLRLTGVLVPDDAGRSRVALAGLLALGSYPQRQHPQLNLTFVSYATPTGESGASGVRFLDNVSVNGPIPVIVSEALQVLRRNMSRRAVVSGAGRRDVWDYPEEALREAVVNALVHRDLSPGSRGMQVQVEMYPDRLVITNPGGLFGPVDLERLGEDGRSSARNALLMKVLEDVAIPGEGRPVCENRGSGIRAMVSALRNAGMGLPAFRDRVTAFVVTLPNHSLLDDETLRWLEGLGREGLRDTQCIGLALMRRGELLDHARYRAATGIQDGRVATFELQDLVARELVQQTGTGRGSRYRLAPEVLAARPAARRPDRRRQVREVLDLLGEASKAEIAEQLRMNPKSAEHWLRVMKSEGTVEATARGTSRATKYRLRGDTGQGDD